MCNSFSQYNILFIYIYIYTLLPCGLTAYVRTAYYACFGLFSGAITHVRIMHLCIYMYMYMYIHVGVFHKMYYCGNGIWCCGIVYSFVLGLS